MPPSAAFRGHAMTTGFDTPVAKAAIVTGSATGIGAAVARALASRGWGVAINYTRSGREACGHRRCVSGRRRRGGSLPRRCRRRRRLPTPCRDRARSVRAGGRAREQRGHHPKFVAAADMDGLDAADFEKIFAVNVLGPFQMTRAARAALEASGDGAIVNISSYSGMNGLGSSLAYAASKGALNTLTKGLAHTLAPRVRVNAVCPGYADTRWARVGLEDEAYERFKAGLEATLPLGRMPSAEDVAETVLWFLTAGRTVTGQLLVVDSGEHMAGGIAPDDG